MGKAFKYQNEIDNMLNNGFSMPHLKTIDVIDSFRFVFCNDKAYSNLPVYIMKPKRQLKNPTVNGFALSCYTDAQKAEEKYNNILESVPNFVKTGGDSLAEIVLDANDGMVTEPTDEYTHFSLFEYSSCDLNKKTHILKNF